MPGFALSNRRAGPPRRGAFSTLTAKHGGWTSGRDRHANVTRNHLCRTMAELMRAVHRYLAARFELAEVIAHAA
jgi:hypothetical protein